MKRIIDLTFVAAWAAGVAYVAWAAGQPDEYLIHVRGILEPQPYSLRSVVALSAFMALHALGFWAMARTWLRQGSAIRLVSFQAVTLAIWLIVILLESTLGMHASPALAAYVSWVMWIGPVLLGLAVVTDGRRAWQLRRGQQAHQTAT